MQWVGLPGGVRAQSASNSDNRSGRSAVLRLLFVPTTALNLAVLRVAVFGALAVELAVSHAVQFSRLPDSLITSPPQISGLLRTLPHSPGVVAAAAAIALAACVAAILGWHTRAATVTAAVTSLYALGIPQLYGKVDHYHHLVWLALLLAASPCADALSLDARGRLTPPRSVRYGFPLRVAWLLIGACYLFPGLAKLGEWRIWLDPHNLRGLLWVQQLAAGGGINPPGWALLPMAAGAIAFEIGFVFAVFNGRLRPWAVAIGIAFHATTFLTMRISFWSLVVCYVAFIDWSRDRSAPDARTPRRTTVVVATSLVAAVGLAGALTVVSAWPFASYPTFTGNYTEANRGSTVQVVAVDHGRRQTVDFLPWLPASRRFAVIENAMQHPAALAQLAREADPDATSIEVWEVTRSAEPRHRGRVISRHLLARASLS